MSKNKENIEKQLETTKVKEETTVKEIDSTTKEKENTEETTETTSDKFEKTEEKDVETAEEKDKNEETTVKDTEKTSNEEETTLEEEVSDKDEETTEIDNTTEESDASYDEDDDADSETDTIDTDSCNNSDKIEDIEDEDIEDEDIEDEDIEDADIDNETSSEDNKEIEHNTSANNIKSKLRAMIWVWIGLILGILTGYCIFYEALSSSIDKSTSNGTEAVENVDSTQKEELTISTYTNPSKIIKSDKDIEEACNVVNNYLDKVIDGSTYSQIMTGDNQYTYYMYNKNGEIFSQNSDGTYTEIFLKDGNVYKYNTEEGVLSVGNDIDAVGLIRNAMSAVGNKNVTLYEMDNSENKDVPPGHEYRVDMVGEEAVSLLYSSLPSDFGKEMVASMKSAVDGWNPHIIMAVFIGDDISNSYCYCLYVIDNKEYTNWLFQGFDKVDDWKLSDKWYSYEPSEDKNGKIYTDLSSDLVSEINDIMKKYADEKGWSDAIESENTDSTESTESTESTDKE